VLLAAVGTLLAIGLSGPEPAAGPPQPAAVQGGTVPVFGGPVLQHWDSLPTAEGFEEIFMVLEATGAPLPIGEARILVDGAPVQARWTDDDGVLGSGDTFAFPLPAFDREHQVALEVGGTVLWSAPFGSGNGTPVDLRR